jgi:hypothetical protein
MAIQNTQFASLQAELITLKHDLKFLGQPTNRIHHLIFQIILFFYTNNDRDIGISQT